MMDTEADTEFSELDIWFEKHILFPAFKVAVERLETCGFAATGVFGKRDQRAIFKKVARTLNGRRFRDLSARYKKTILASAIYYTQWNLKSTDPLDDPHFLKSYHIENAGASVFLDFANAIEAFRDDTTPQEGR